MPEVLDKHCRCRGSERVAVGSGSSMLGICSRALFRPPLACRRLCISTVRPVYLTLGTPRLGNVPNRLYSTQTQPQPPLSPSDSASSKPRDPINSTQKLSLSSLASIFRRGPQGASSFRKIVALAKPERRPLLIAIGLLLASSAVSMSIPFTIGKLIDFFSSPNPVRPYPSWHYHLAQLIYSKYL